MCSFLLFLFVSASWWLKTLLTPMSFQISFCETLEKILGEISVFFSSFVQQKWISPKRFGSSKCHILCCTEKKSGFKRCEGWQNFIFGWTIPLRHKNMYTINVKCSYNVALTWYVEIAKSLTHNAKNIDLIQEYSSSTTLSRCWFWCLN